MGFRGVILVLIVAALAVLLIPTGCGREPREVVITEEADGETIVLQVGDTLVLKLDSNPTTGYCWFFPERVDPYVLKRVGNEFVERPRLPGHMGVGGQEVWRFKAIAEGETVLHLAYVRTWEEGVEPARTFFVWVTVEP